MYNVVLSCIIEKSGLNRIETDFENHLIICIEKLVLKLNIILMKSRPYGLRCFWIFMLALVIMTSARVVVTRKRLLLSLK